MAPKSKKKNKNKDKKDVGVKAVDKTFYELEIADLNRKLAHLRSFARRTEERSMALEAEAKSRAEDREDVMAYLDRTLQEKQNSIKELDEKMTELSKLRDEETVEFKRQLRESDLNYKQMQDELTSEIKLMTGKMHSLEEFHSQKDDLIAKFDQQQDELRTQTKQHDEIIYEIERQQILNKNRMKHEVENRLLELSNAFAKSNEVRIAAHVQRLVRENIALNNEMDRLMYTQRRLQKQCDEMTAEAQKRRATLQTVLEEKQHLVRVGDVRLTIIERLTDELEMLREEAIVLNETKNLHAQAEQKIAVATKRESEAVRRALLLERELHAERSETENNRTVFSQQAAEMVRLTQLLKEIKFSLRSAMTANVDAMDDQKLREFRAAQRKYLLNDLMDLVNQAYVEPTAVASFETIQSAQEIYQRARKGKAAAPVGSCRKRRSLVTATMLMLENVSEEEGGKSTANLELAEDSASSVSKAKSEGSSVIVDVESGSALVFSESSEAEAPPDPDALEDNDDDGGVSVSD